MIYPVTIECSIKDKRVSPIDILVQRCIMSMCLVMETSDFKIDVVDGKTSITLQRPLTTDEAWKLGAELTRVAKEVEDDRNRPIESVHEDK